MSESEFLDLIDTTLAEIEEAVEDGAADVECARTGNVLSLEFEDGSKIIINSQNAMQELWLAARGGGFHFRFRDGSWRDTRDEVEFYARLSEEASRQARVAVRYTG